MSVIGVKTIQYPDGPSSITINSSGNVSMPGTLSVTGVSSFANGTNSAPSLTFTSDTNTGIYRGGTDILKFVTAGTDAITIDASQNVTLANKLSLKASLTNPITFENQHSVTTDASISTFDDANGTLIALGSNFYLDNSGSEQRFNTGEENSAVVLNRTGTVQLKTNGTGGNAVDRLKVDNNGDISFYEDTGTTPKFFWDASAECLNVGTTSSEGKFNVNISAAADYPFRLTNTSSGGYGLLVTAGDGSNALAKFRDYAGNDRVYISGAGNVGIGTSSPNTSLDVVRAGTQPLRVESSNGTEVQINMVNTGGNVQLEAHSGNFNIDADAVGIGTSSPSELIHANGSSVSALKLTTNSYTNGTVFKVQGDGASYIYNTENAMLRLGTNNLERIRIDSNGHVGILNTAPANYLDGELVVGNSTKDQYINVVTGTGNAAGICFQDTTGTSIIGGLRYTHLDNALAFWANGSERMRITSTGNVGIGTTNPSTARLEVRDDTNASDTLEVSATLQTAGQYHDLAIGSGNAYGVGMRRHITTSTPAFLNPRLDFFVQNNNTYLPANRGVKMTILGSGNVGIGTTSPTVSGKGIEIHNDGNDTLASIRLAGNNNTGTPGQKFNTELRYNGAAGFFQIMHYGSGNSLGTERFRISAGGDTFTNDGSISSLSDSRVKKDIANLQDGLAIVNQLRPVTFKYNGAASMTPDDDKINYGFIADEVQAVASHYVQENTEEINGVTVTDLKSLSTGRMIPMLFKAVQELSAKVNTLETANTALEARITALENT